MCIGAVYVLSLTSMAEIVKICSITPGIPERNPFWILGSMMVFARRNFSRRLAMILLYNLPTVDVKAIGLNKLGEVAGPDLYTGMIFPTHHEAGQVWDSSRILENSYVQQGRGRQVEVVGQARHLPYHFPPERLARETTSCKL